MIVNVTECKNVQRDRTPGGTGATEGALFIYTCMCLLCDAVIVNVAECKDVQRERTPCATGATECALFIYTCMCSLYVML